LGTLTARGLTTKPEAFVRGKIAFAVFINDGNRSLFRDLDEVVAADRMRDVESPSTHTER
jgi:hypothetical protein